MNPQSYLSTLFLADTNVGWPSALVALALICLVGLLMGIAMWKHSVDEAMKLWGGLGVVVGIMTGTFGTYFFTREAAKAGQEAVQATRDTLKANQEAAQAKIAAVQAERDRAIADVTSLKLVDPTAYKFLPSKEPSKENQAVLFPNPTKKDEAQPN